MPERESQIHPEGEFLFDLDSILVLSFPHLERLLVIDARVGQKTQSTFFLDKKEIISPDTKEAIASDLRQAIMKTPNDFSALFSLSNQVPVIMAHRFGALIADRLPSKLTPSPGNPDISYPPVAVAVFSGSVESFWDRHQRTIVGKLAGNIGLIADVRTRFEELIQEEKQAPIRGGGDTFHTLWQNPTN